MVRDEGNKGPVGNIVTRHWRRNLSDDITHCCPLLPQLLLPYSAARNYSSECVRVLKNTSCQPRLESNEDTWQGDG